ncbi:MAG: DUF998 domain-containing protein [Promethearchaeota archaeon]
MSGFYGIIKPKTAAYLGIIGPIWALVSIFISIALSPWFSWTNNALSDLGNYATSSVAILYNSGLIIAAICAMIFALGLYAKERQKIAGKIGIVFLFVTAISLLGVAVFSEDFGSIHYYFSVALFALFIITCFILGTHYFSVVKTKWLGILSFIIAIISIAGWVIQWTISWGPGVAIPESLTAFPVAILVAILAARLYRSTK